MPNRIDYAKTVDAFKRGDISETLFYIRTRAAARRGDQAAIDYLRAHGKVVPGGRGARSCWPGQTRAQIPQPVSKPTPKPTAPKIQRPKAPRIPKLFSRFLNGRCKDLRLAAKILGITPKPPLISGVLRKAWIELISKHHPDRNGVAEAAAAVNAAYQLLRPFAR